MADDKTPPIPDPATPPQPTPQGDEDANWSKLEGMIGTAVEKAVGKAWESHQSSNPSGSPTPDPSKKQKSWLEKVITG